MAHRDPKNKEIKKKRRSTKKQKRMACHVFVETIHVVAAPHVFACMVYLRRSRIVYVSLKSVQEFWSHRGRNLPFSFTLSIGYYNIFY